MYDQAGTNNEQTSTSNNNNNNKNGLMQNWINAAHMPFVFV